MFNNNTNKRVLCVGICTLDIVQICDSFPIEDSDERCLEGYWQRGGNASNNCSVLSQLDTDCTFLGTLSKKDHLQFLIKDFHSYNIKIDGCAFYENVETPLSTVILCKNTGSRTILHTNPNLPDLTFEDFKKINIPNYKWIHFEGRNVREVQKMMQSIHEVNLKLDVGQNVVISVEFEKCRPELHSLLSYSDIIFLSKEYAINSGSNSMTEALKKMKNSCKPGAIVICAWGAEGAGAIDQKGGLLSSPAYPPLEIVDTLGAGDTFCAGVIAGLINNQSLQDSLSFGCKIAGAKVGMKGYKGLGNFYTNLKSTHY